MTEMESALYPPEPGGPSNPAPAEWFSTLRSVLERTASAAGADDAAAHATVSNGSRPSTEQDSGDQGPSSGIPESIQATDTSAATVATDLMTRLRRLSPEAADVPPQVLGEFLDRHAANIEMLVQAFHLRDDALLTALGRGWLPDGRGLDPVTHNAQPTVTELDGVVSSSCVTVSRHGRSTTLIAAVTVAEPTGPNKLTDPYWAQNGMHDVWLCAVPPASDQMDVACALLERILPQVGVLSAQLTPTARSPRTAEDRRPRPLAVAIRQVAPTEDPDVILGRLEGWRATIEQVGGGDVAIAWEHP